MAFLTGLLDDADTRPCGMCDVCAGPRFDVPLHPADVERAAQFLRSQTLEIEPRKRWPVGLSGVRGAIPVTDQLEPGQALCRWGDGGWAVEVRHGKQTAGRFSDDLVEGLAAMVRRWDPQPPPNWITYVPSRRHVELVPDLARRLATQLRLPLLEAVNLVGTPAPQKTMQNSAQQVRNLIEAFRVADDVPTSPVLLVDDIVDSRWTLTIVGRSLRQAGSGPVFPVALASAAG